MRKQHNISVGMIRQYLRYEDGKLFWNKRSLKDFNGNKNACGTWNSRFAEKEAGNIHEKIKGYKYCRITINYQWFTRTQLVWAILKGEFSEKELDHKDRNPLNDKIENIRQCDRSESQRNLKRRLDNTSGHKGISFAKHYNKWHAYINIKGKRINIGHFDTREEAIKAREQFAEQLHGEFANEE